MRSKSTIHSHLKRSITSHFTVLALVVIGVFMVSASSPAKADWLPVENLSFSGKDAYEPQIAVNTSGYAVAVWRRTNGFGKVVVQASTRKPGGGWSQPATVSSYLYDAYSLADVGIDRYGNAVAVWGRYGGNSSRTIQASTRPLGNDSEWSKPVNLDTVFGIGGGDEPQVAVSQNGYALAAWESWPSPSYHVIKAAWKPAGMGWILPAAEISPHMSDVSSPRVAVDSNGNAVVTWWNDHSAKSNWNVMAATRPALKDWGKAKDLSPATYGVGEPESGPPDIAAGPQGHSVAVWGLSTQNSDAVQAATHAVGVDWWTQAATIFSSVDFFGTGMPKVATDPNGNSYAVWPSYDEKDKHWLIQSARLPMGGSWSYKADISKSGQDAESPQIALDTYGNAVAVWRRFNGKNWVIQTSRKPKQVLPGFWSSPQDLSLSGQDAEDPQVAAGQSGVSGNAVAAWRRFDGKNWVIQASVYDAG